MAKEKQYAKGHYVKFIHFSPFLVELLSLTSVFYKDHPKGFAHGSLIIKAHPVCVTTGWGILINVNLDPSVSSLPCPD